MCTELITVTRAKSICHSDKLSKEVKRIKLFISWNNFPKHISNKCEKHDDNDPKIWIRVPYIGEFTDRIVKQSIQKLKKCMKTPHVNFCVTYMIRRKLKCLSKPKISL